jgi:general secretion pathway protein J
VRWLREATQPTRWQVVRYRLEGDALVRETSAPLNARSAARDAIKEALPERLVLVEHTSALQVRGWSRQGWLASPPDASQPASSTAVPGMLRRMSPNTVTGLEVTITVSNAPYTKVVLPDL